MDPRITAQSSTPSTARVAHPDQSETRATATARLGSEAGLWRVDAGGTSIKVLGPAGELHVLPSSRELTAPAVIRWLEDLGVDDAKVAWGYPGPVSHRTGRPEVEPKNLGGHFTTADYRCLGEVRFENDAAVQARGCFQCDERGDPLPDVRMLYAGFGGGLGLAIPQSHRTPEGRSELFVWPLELAHWPKVTAGGAGTTTLGAKLAEPSGREETAERLRLGLVGDRVVFVEGGALPALEASEKVVVVDLRGERPDISVHHGSRVLDTRLDALPWPEALSDGQATFEDTTGARALRLSPGSIEADPHVEAQWKEAVREVVTLMRDTFLVNDVCLGGGNSKRFRSGGDEVGPGVRLAPDGAAFRGLATLFS